MPAPPVTPPRSNSSTLIENLLSDEYNTPLEVLHTIESKEFHLGNANLLDHVKWVKSGRQHFLVPKKPDVKVHDRAVIEWIGEISDKSFWLYPCGGWAGEKGPHGTWDRSSPFEKAKARGHTRCPEHPKLASPWTRYIDNLNKLMRLITSSSDDHNINYSITDDDEIIIRHSLFEVRCTSTTIHSLHLIPLHYLA
jgi:hypothetical protein